MNKDKEPTDEQKKRFWVEGCEFKQLSAGKGGYHFWATKKIWNWLPPNETERHKSIPFLPPIDPNSLFKYAVPKLGDVAIEIYSPDGDKNWTCLIRKSSKPIICYCPDCSGDFVGYNEDPTLALFWACYKSFGLEE